MVQFPSCIEGIVPIVNIPGVKSGKLKLSGPVLAQIHPGQDHQVERQPHQGPEPRG